MIEAQSQAPLTVEVGPESPPLPPPSPAGAARPALSGTTCSYELPSQITGTFSSSGEAVVAGTVISRRSERRGAPTIKTRFTLDIYSLEAGEPTLATSLG